MAVRHLLLVEDNAMNQELAVELLQDRVRVEAVLDLDDQAQAAAIEAELKLRAEPGAGGVGQVGLQHRPGPAGSEFFAGRTPQGQYLGQALAGYGMMWNTRYMAANKLPAPKQWADLTAPVYFGHVAMSSPSRSGMSWSTNTKA